MLRKLFEEKVYVKVSRNRFEIMKVSGESFVEVVCSPEPFSTSRLPIGEFIRAELWEGEELSPQQAFEKLENT